METTKVIFVIVIALSYVVFTYLLLGERNKRITAEIKFLEADIEKTFIFSVLGYMVHNHYVGLKKINRAAKIVQKSSKAFSCFKVNDIKEEDIDSENTEWDGAEQTRVCKKCGKELPITDFQEDPIGSGWRRHTCIECRNKQKRKIYQMNS